MERHTEHQLRLGRLLEIKDFRLVIAGWLELGITPWSGPVGPDQASDASYVNGRAAFISQLIDEIREYFPSHYIMIQEERFDVRRRTTELDGQQSDER